MTFTQLTTRLKNFLMGWMLVLGLKEGLVECATVGVKSEVILIRGITGSILTLLQYTMTLLQGPKYTVLPSLMNI